MKWIFRNELESANIFTTMWCQWCSNVCQSETLRSVTQHTPFSLHQETRRMLYYHTTHSWRSVSRARPQSLNLLCTKCGRETLSLLFFNWKPQKGSATHFKCCQLVNQISGQLFCWFCFLTIGAFETKYLWLGTQRVAIFISSRVSSVKYPESHQNYDDDDVNRWLCL